jgi:hypothetical protein
VESKIALPSTINLEGDMSKEITIPTVIIIKDTTGNPRAELVLATVPIGKALGSVAQSISACLFTMNDPNNPQTTKFRLGWFAGTFESIFWIQDPTVPIRRSMGKHVIVAIREDLIGAREPTIWGGIARGCVDLNGVGEILDRPPTRDIFIIHGHDQKALRSLTAFLEKLGLKPIVLEREPHLGSETLIESLERLLPVSDFIVALLTPDDEGRKMGSSDDFKPRARQNVLIEAGYAIIQRRADSVIIALSDTEIPSDFDGIRRIQAKEWCYTVEEQLSNALSPFV